MGWGMRNVSEVIKSHVKWKYMLWIKRKMLICTVTKAEYIFLLFYFFNVVKKNMNYEKTLLFFSFVEMANKLSRDENIFF